MIAIVEQVARSLVPRKGVPQLLGGPRRRRMGRDGNMPDASPVMCEEHQDEQEAIGHRRTTKKSAATIWPT